MYHRARAGPHGNAAEMLDAHFRHVASHCHTVLPGERLSAERRNVCLSFDDGYFDFFATVFPLLEKHDLRAVLALPPALLRDAVDGDRASRLALESGDAFSQPDRGGFCTWGEVAALVKSGRVVIAAHGLTHVRLDGPDVDLDREVDSPGARIETALGCPVDSFVFPFGRFSVRSLARAKARYRHVFRIGGALNRGWDGRVLYRVDADGMTAPQALFAPARLVRYRARYFWNQLRRR